MSKSRKTLGIGIVGCGLMGDVHADAYSRSPGCRIVAATNRTREKAEALTKRYGGKVYDTLKDLLADPEVDAVSVCTDQDVHAEQIIVAAKAGKHILAEKPLALTVKELNAVEREVKRNRVTLMVGHQLRLHPVTEAVSKAAKKLGRCYHLDLEMCFRIDADAGRCWRSYRHGGFFMELGVHLADLAAHLMGTIDNVTAHTIRLNPRRVTEDYTNCLLQFESGAVGSIIVSANHRTTRQGLLRGRLLGEKGRIDFTIYPYARAMNEATMVIDHGKAIFVPDTTVTKLKIPARKSLSKVYPGFYDVYDREVRSFISAVTKGTKPAVTLADGRSAVEVVLAAYDAQGQATSRKNFRKRPTRYRSDGSCHPALRKG